MEHHAIAPGDAPNDAQKVEYVGEGKHRISFRIDKGLADAECLVEIDKLWRSAFNIRDVFSVVRPGIFFLPAPSKHRCRC